MPPHPLTWLILPLLLFSTPVTGQPDSAAVADSGGRRILGQARELLFTEPTAADRLVGRAIALLDSATEAGALSDAYNYRANYHYMAGRYALVYTHLDTAIHFAERDGDSLHTAGLRGNLGMMAMEAGDLDRALATFNENLGLFTAWGDTSLMGQALVARANLRIRQGYYAPALTDVYSALDHFRAVAEEDRIADAEQFLATIYHKRGDFDQAVASAKRALASYDRAEMPTYRVKTLGFLAQYLVDAGNYGEAEPVLSECLRESRRLGQYFALAKAHAVSGQLHHRRDLPAAALAALDSAAYYYDELESPVSLGGVHLARAEALVKSGRPTAGLGAIARAEAALGDYPAPEVWLDLLRLKANLLEQRQQHPAALAALRQRDGLRDSLHTAERTRAVEELHIVHQTEDRIREMELLSARAAALDNDLKLTKLRNRSLLGGLLLLGLSGGLLFLFQQQRRRRINAEAEVARTKLENEVRYQRRELAAKTLHLVQRHDLLREIGDRVEQLPVTDAAAKRRLLSTITTEEALDQDWRGFTEYFRQVYGDFDQQLDAAQPNLNETERRLARLLRMGMTNAEIASLLRIQPGSVRTAKYRLKQRLGLAQKDNLGQWLRGG